jgi:hypothetical protein
MPNANAARLEPVPCPICARPLKSTADRWLPAFECERCGQFSDFGDASLSPAQSRHSSARFPRAAGPARSESRE